MHVKENEFVFKKSFFALDNIDIDPLQEIKEYLIDKIKPTNQEEICIDLAHISRKKVLETLHGNREFIRNSKGEYFHPDAIIITNNEIRKIESYIDYYISKNGFLTGTELLEFLENSCPEIRERYYYLSDLGIRDLIGYKMKDKFSFNSKVISGLGEDLSVADVYVKTCENNSYLTLEQLRCLKKELNTVIYFDVIYENKLRINEEEFVSKERANFDVYLTDKAIDGYCLEEYIAIKDIEYFSSFPECDFKWNSYLLENYVYKYSERYKLIHNGFNEKSCVGGIVKLNSDIESFYDLVVKVLIDSDIVLNTSTALDYLYEKGYIGRRSYSEIDKALTHAKAMKERMI